MANEIVTKEPQTAVSTDILSDFTAFENAQRIGKMLTQSAIIPASFQNNLPNVMVALEISCRNKLSPIVVMQNLNVIQGRPSWSSKFIIAALTTSRVLNLHYELVEDGEVEVPGGFNGAKKKIKNLKCRAIANDRKTGEERIGPWVTMQMAIAEGWYGKSGSKWQTMPEVMIRYRAATFFASVYYPDLSVGIDVADDDTSTPANIPAVNRETVATGEIVEPAPEEKAKPKRKKAEPKTIEVEAEPVTVEAEPVEDKPAPVVAPQADNEDEWGAFDD